MDLEQTLKYSNFFDNCIYQLSRPMILSYLSGIDFNVIFNNTLKTSILDIPNISTEFKLTELNVMVDSVGFDSFKNMVEKDLLILDIGSSKDNYYEIKKEYLFYLYSYKPLKFNYDIGSKINLKYKEKITMFKNYIESKKLSIDYDYKISSEPYSLIERCLKNGNIVPEQLPYVKYISKIISILDNSHSVQMKHVAESLQYFIRPRIIYEGN